MGSEDLGAAADTADRPDRCRSRIGTKQQREGQIFGPHTLAFREIRCRTCDPQYTVVAARGEAPRSDRVGKEAFCLRVDGAEPFDLGDREVGVHSATGRGKTLAHPLARREDAVTHVRRRLAAFITQPLEGYARNVNAQVNAIEYRTGKPAAIALDLIRKAGALAFGVAPESAGARVHRSDEDESRGVRRGAAGPRDRDGVFLQRLAKRIEHASGELRDLVQEQGAAMSQADFTRAWRRAAADERKVRCGVMRCAEWPRREDRMARVGETRHAVHRARGERLGVVERGKDRLESAREHRLASARWADQEKVVSTCRSDLERALRGFLSCDVREVDRMSWRGGTRRNQCRGDAGATLKMLHDLAKRRKAERLDAAGGGLARVRLGCEDLPDAARRSMANAGHRAANGSKLTVKRKLAEAERGDVHAQLSARAKDPQGDRELEAGPFFAALGRRQIHRDSTKRELKARIADGGAHPLPRFLDRRIRKADDDQGGQAVRDIDLDRDESCLEAPERAGGDARDGARGRGPFGRRDRDGGRFGRAEC